MTTHSRYCHNCRHKSSSVENEPTKCYNCGLPFADIDVHPKIMQNADETITERHNSHGEFKDNAFTSQGIKYLIHGHKNHKTLTATQREALDMIALKISRILSGDNNFADHWHDIAGYARLAELEIDRQ